MKNVAAACVGVIALSAALGCNKFKSMLDKDQGQGGTAAPTVALLSGFEGEVGLIAKPGAKDRNAKPIPPLTLFVKESKVRIDAPPSPEMTQALGGKAYAVLNAPEKKLYAVLEERKQVFVLDLDKAGEQMKSLAPGGRDRAPGASPPHAPPKVVKTGQKDKVAGYTCENWEIVDPEKGSKISLCIAEEGASWFRLPLMGLPTEYTWMLELMDGKHFPLRFIAYEKDGTEGGRLEVTKIEKKALAAQMFEIPAGYQVMSFEQMMAQLMSGAMRAGALPPGAPPGFALPPGVAHPPGARPPAAPPQAPKPKHN